MDIRIYLSGSIKKGKHDTSNKFYWTEDEITILRETLNPEFHLITLNPAIRTDDLSDYQSTFGRDLLQVLVSDFVLVDARDKKGLGVGAEMTFAKTNGIPVISVAPPDSQYNRFDFEYLGQRMDHWIHPFVAGLSDYVATSVQDAGLFIKKNFPFDIKTVKTSLYLYDSIRHYLDTQSQTDIEMAQLINSDSIIRRRIESVLNE